MSEEDRKKVNPAMTIKQIRELKNTLALASVPTSEQIEEEKVEYDVSDEEEKDPPKSMKDRLVDLLVEGYRKIQTSEYYSCVEMAAWLISQGVTIK